MLDRTWEEQAARLARLLAIELPDEEVLVHLIEEEERDEGKAVDDGRDDAVRNGCEQMTDDQHKWILHKKISGERTDNHKKGDGWEQGSPRYGTERVLDAIDRARRGAQNEQLHVVQHERDDLQEPGGGTGEALEDDIAAAQ